MRYRLDSLYELLEVAQAWPGLTLEAFCELPAERQAIYIAHHRARGRLSEVLAEQERRKRKQGTHGAGAGRTIPKRRGRR